MTDQLKKTKKKRKRSSSPPLPEKNRKTDAEVMDVVREGAQTPVPTVLIPFRTPDPTPVKEPDTPPTISKRDLLIPEAMELLPSVQPGKKVLDASLLMQSGSLTELLRDEDKAWTAIAGKLKKDFLPYQQSLKTKAEQADYVAELCTIYYGPGKTAMTKDGPDAEFTDQVPAVVSFLEKFMDANGQWAYLEQQDWFKEGEYVIGIDVNYYPDRSGYKASPIFHKDTGGNNIFVNLVFDNEKPIEATEWFADLEEPSKKRKAWQQKLLPESHLEELDKARKALEGEFGKDTNVRGGVSPPGAHTYVSWTDDLVWHATPTDKARIVFTADTAKATYKFLNYYSKRDKDFAYYDGTHKRNMLGVEILGTMAEAKDTRLHQWLTEQDLGPQDIDVALAKRAWNELYSGMEGQALFGEDAEKRAKSSQWRITGEFSEATAEDPRLTGTSSMKETPLSLASRRRANSLNPEAMEQVRKDNEGVPRSFIRTWVRILRNDSDELVKAGVM